MDRSDPIVVIGKDGLQGTIDSAALFASNQEYVPVRLDDGRQIFVPTEALILQMDNTYYLPMSLAELKNVSNSGQGNVIVVPVIAEELEVQKRWVETGGVRVTKRVHEREEVIDEPLLQEELDVQRVAVNRPVDGPLPIRYQGDTMIVPLLEEVLVVEKRLMLKEELHITRRQVEGRRPQSVTLRTEEAVVERLEQPEVGPDDGTNPAAKSEE